MIVLPAGTFPLGGAGKGEDKGAKGDLDVLTANLTLAGKAPVATVIDGKGIDRVLDVAPFTNVTVRDIRIRGGVIGAGDDEPKGAGIRVRGVLTLQRVFLESNNAGLHGDGGGLFVEKGAAADIRETTVRINVAERGGGMYISGNAELTNVTFSGNNVFNAGGGVFVSEDGKASLLHVTGLQLLNTAANGIPVHRLAGRSPAVNFALPGPCPKVDARGVSRPQGGRCDSGAVERQSSDP